MTFIIKYTETDDEIAANIEAVRATENPVLADWGISSEEWVAEWKDLLVCDVDNVVRGGWSLGGVELHEAHQFATREDAEAWIAKYKDTEPGTFEIVPL